MKEINSLWHEMLMYFPVLFLFHDGFAPRKIKCTVVEFPVFLGLRDFASYLGFLHLKNIRKILTFFR